MAGSAGFREAENGGSDSVAAGSSASFEAGEASVGTVVIPDAALLTSGAFRRADDDLMLTAEDGAAFVVSDYFAGERAPALVSPDGGLLLTPAMVRSFLPAESAVQYAQAGPITFAATIGQVDEINGDVFVIRVDGTRVQLSKGDPVFEGDIVETGGDGSAVRLLFVDKTVFALGQEARLALDQLVFNPATMSGVCRFSILKGIFIFSSGQIAKADNTNMTVFTPIGTIGIRGTEVAGHVVGPDGGQFTVIDGAIEITTLAGTVALDKSGETTIVASIGELPGTPFVLTPQQYGDAYQPVAGIAATYFTGQPTGDPMAGSNPHGPNLAITASEGLASQAEPFSGVVDPLSLPTFPMSAWSPFRVESGDPFADNPSIWEPYGRAALSSLSQPDRVGSSEPSVSAVPPRDVSEVRPTPTPPVAETVGEAGAPQDTSPSPPSPPPPQESQEPHSVVLTLSHAAIEQRHQDLSSSYVLPDLGPNSVTEIGGREMNIPGVPMAASLTLERRDVNDVTVTLTSPWNSVKNIRAESEGAATVMIHDFVHTDVHLGDGGDSHIVLTNAKRGFISTGDGNDIVEIDVFSNGNGWSDLFEVHTGDGDDLIIFSGAQNGLTRLVLDGGAGIDTLRLTGPGQYFDLTSSGYDLSGIERIDLGAVSGATLVLDAERIRGMTDDALVIEGMAGDTLSLSDDGWTRAGETAGQGYSVYQHESGAQLVVADAVAVA